MYSRDNHYDEEEDEFDDFINLRGRQPKANVTVDSPIGETTLDNFTIGEQRIQIGNYRLNAVNPDNITENQRRNETNGNIISNATGWVEIKIDKIQGEPFRSNYNEDPIYFMWAYDAGSFGILIHYFDNDTWLGCTQISRGRTGSSTMYLIGRCPADTRTIYIDIANDDFSSSDNGWGDLSPSLTKENVVSNLMIVLPTFTYPFAFNDSASLQDYLGDQANAPYISGLKFEPYSDYYSPSLNHPCDIPVTKCPEGYTAVLGIGDDFVDKLQKFNFPSDLELYPGEDLCLSTGYATQFHKKFTIDSTTSFSDATLELMPEYPQNFIRIDVKNPFGFTNTENIRLNYISINIISNRFNFFTQEAFLKFYSGTPLFNLKGDTVFFGWVKTEDYYNKIWDGYLYISSDTIKTAEQAREFFTTNTAEIVVIDSYAEFIEKQEIPVKQPESLSLIFPKGSNPFLDTSKNVYCYFTPTLENGEIDPDKNTKDYWKLMCFSFDAFYMRQKLYNDIVSNSNNIDKLINSTSYPTFSFMNLSVSPFSPYYFITYMYPFVPYICDEVDIIYNIGTFGKSLPGGDYCHWIPLDDDAPLEYEMIFIGGSTSEVLKGINFPPNVKLIWKDGVAPLFKAGKDYRIKITLYPERDSKYDYKQPCFCTWEEY